MFRTAARHDSPLLEPSLDCLERFIPFAEPPTVHLDRGYEKMESKLAALGADVVRVK